MKKIKTFYKKETELTKRYFDDIYFSIYKSIFEVLNIDYQTVPVIYGNYEIYTKFSNKDLAPKIHIKNKKNNSILVIDPNRFIYEMSWYYPSNSGELIAYTTEINGLEIYKCYINDLKSNKTKDHIEDLYKFIDWKNDEGFFYIKKDYSSGDIRNYSSYIFNIYYHVIGDNQINDKKITINKDKYFSNNPFWEITLSDDYRYLIASNEDNNYTNFIIIKDLISNRVVYKKHSQNPLYASIQKDKLYLYSYGNKGFGEIRTLYINNPKAGLKTLIKQKKYLFVNYSFSQDVIYCIYLKDVGNFIRIYNYNGEKIRDIFMKEKGTIYITSSSENNDIYFSFSSFITPYTIYKYIFKEDKLIKIYQSKVKPQFKRDNYAQQYKLVKSKDGTRIPIFIVYNKNTVLEKQNPLLLSAYGGFGISSIPEYDPWYSHKIFLFLNNGGIYVHSIIRGGGEFGKNWHKQAMGAKNKMKSIEDFTCVSRYLIDNKYTSENNLYIHGISHGGFIVLASMLLYPSLYKGVISEVPVTDLKNCSDGIGVFDFIKTEYGDPNKKKDLQHMLKLSPYQNIKNGIKYPDLLIIGRENDTRVSFFDILKFFKKMKSHSLGKTFLLVEYNVGHRGAQNNVARAITQSNILSLIYKTSGLVSKK